MPDLSKMLGDVYDAPAADAPRPEDGPITTGRRPVPEWSDDEHLDRAFAGWTPGPSADAPAAERKLFAGADTERGPLADDLATALSEAVLAEQQAEPEAPATDQAPAPFAPAPPAMRPTAFGTLTSDSLVAPPGAAEPSPVEVAGPATVSPPLPEPPGEDVADERTEPEPVAVTRAQGAWQRSDDDILPTGGKAGFFSLSLRRR